MSATLSTDKEVLEQVGKDNVKFVNLQFIDLFGVVKNVTISAIHLEESFKNGTWFDGSSIEGFARIHESDMFLKPDPSTYSIIPWLNSTDGNTARLICDVFTANGKPFEGDPRFILKKVLKEADDMGYVYNTGPELEFFLFRKENGKLSPLPHDKGGYFDLSMDHAYEVRRDMAVTLGKFGISVEALHHEVAVGQHEIDFCYGPALKTADNATTMRFVLKAVAEKHGLHATFMPKPIAGINGTGMHVHQSLFKNGENAFFDGNDPHNLSGIAKNFIAGQLKHIQGMSAITSPTVNSYKRLAPGYEAPVYISWAKTNRSALIRVPAIKKEKPKASRIELRCPDPSCNIYLAFAVMLKAGLDGMKNKYEPPQSVEEDLYEFDDTALAKFNVTQLPYSLFDAIKYMRKSDLVKEVLGESTYKKYLDAKLAEWDEYRLQVTQWELDRYLETY
ncbi:Glutamine synthetase [Candidatus Bilamarchaeum dharawalense]|uniref:Glutamine synthetase n=1 Tax=Candidatus Bilamarchaeum dharawalense TaxID=2885759 RepID=A0A5E4LNK5_9ARCH|nr:Glutamine synthetase [Candidatus Bilamarchaeum dharawalense]